MENNYQFNVSEMVHKWIISVVHLFELKQQKQLQFFKDYLGLLRYRNTPSI